MAGSPKKRARVEVAKQQITVEQICERISAGESLRNIARSINAAETTLRSMLRREEAAAHYARAREDRAHRFAEEINELADQVIAGQIPTDAARVAIDAKKWTASRLMPAAYGDRQQVDQTIDLTLRLSPAERDARIAQLLARK